MFQTPMSALGLPQTRLRGRDISPVGVKEAAQFRRRRMLAIVALAALCMCATMTWRLFMQLPPSVASSSRSLSKTLDTQQPLPTKIKTQLVDNPQLTEKRQETRGFRDDKQIVMVFNHFRNSDECAQTLVEARKLAFLASRVHFRVFEELYLNQEETCVQRFCELKSDDCKQMLHSGQLRAQRRDASGATGPAVGKFVAEGLVEREKFADDFYLSVDPAVVVFTQDWDLSLLKQWYIIGNDMAIMSVSPKSIELQGSTNNTVLVQCSAHIHSKSPDAVVEFNPPEMVPRQGSVLLAPVLQPHYSEIFHFGPTRALFDVRSDPYTPLISVGHEYARAARFWTRGYDFYAPNEDTLFARYKWQEPPFPLPARGIDDDTEQQQQRCMNKSNRRIRHLLRLPVSIKDSVLEQSQVYSPGGIRSMEAWQAFSGIDPRAAYDESTTNQFTLCGAVARHQLHYVPY